MSLWSRLKSGLSRSSEALGNSLSGLMGGKKLSAETLGELEDALIMADLGVATAAIITDNLRARRDLAELDDGALRAALAGEIAALLEPVESTFSVSSHQPHVILQGWGARAKVRGIAGAAGADAAGLAFQALEQAQADKIDVLMIDTAGRLQSNDNLMAELSKIIRVAKKLDATAPHESLLILDATTGQNAIAQAEAFLGAAQTTGLIMTKLDGTARGGGLVPIAQKLALPIYFIGVGEQADDLQVFSANGFARALVGLEEEAG